jgi:hypothetical protein
LNDQTMPNGMELPCTRSTRASVTTACHTKSVRHSSVGGINRPMPHSA